MKNYILSLFTPVFFIALAGCNQKNASQGCEKTPNVILRVNLDKKQRSSNFINEINDICNTFGKVVEIQSTSTNAKEDSAVFASISLSQISEGFLPESGKELPVYKVQLWAKDFSESSRNDSLISEEEYIGITSDTLETNQKIQKSFKYMLSSFISFYKKEHPRSGHPVIHVEVN